MCIYVCVDTYTRRIDLMQLKMKCKLLVKSWKMHFKTVAWYCNKITTCRRKWCVYILFTGFITKCSWENQLQQPLNYMLNWLQTHKSQWISRSISPQCLFFFRFIFRIESFENILANLLASSGFSLETRATNFTTLLIRV